MILKIYGAAGRASEVFDEARKEFKNEFWAGGGGTLKSHFYKLHPLHTCFSYIQ